MNSFKRLVRGFDGGDLGSRRLCLRLIRKRRRRLLFSLLPDDLVVTISDGISQSFEDSVGLLELLSEKIDPVAPLSLIARRIPDEAKAKNSRSDDMTVAIVRVGEGKR